jgi:hypothetical protein
VLGELEEDAGACLILCLVTLQSRQEVSKEELLAKRMDGKGQRNERIGVAAESGAALDYC